MYPNGKRSTVIHFSSGFSLPVVIFIIVILSLIAVAINRLSETGAESYIKSFTSNQVFYAAESGIQLSLPAVLSTTPCGCPAANTTINFSVSGLEGCRAEVGCSATVIAGNTYCHLVSAGSCNAFDAQRTVEVRVK